MADKRIELARTLITQTDAGEIEWEILSGENTVVANLHNGRIVVSRESVGSSLDIVVRVYNSQGNIAEEFSDVTLKELDENFPWYTKLGEMLEGAKRKALGADELLEQIIQELRTGVPF